MRQIQTTLPGLISAVQAADSGSFTAAGAALNLSPAAVSKNIAKLEDFLQVRLFNRTTRRLSLTEEGRLFVAKTRMGLGLLDDAARQATQGLQPQGLVRVNCPVGFGRKYVLPALPGFYAAFPNVQIELNLNDQAVDLVGEGFDVGIRGGSQPPEGMVARTIFKDSTILVATPQYLAQRGVPQHYSDLSNHDLLRVKFLSGRLLPWLFKDKSDGKERVVAFEGQAKLIISDPEIILDAALKHMGIAGLGRYDTYEALKNAHLTEVLPDRHEGVEFSMSMFYPHRSGLAPRVRAFVDYVLKTLAKEPSFQRLV